MLWASSRGEIGCRTRQSGRLTSPRSCNQIVAHREAAKATSQVLYSLHIAKLKIVNAEGKAWGKSPEGETQSI